MADQPLGELAEPQARSFRHPACLGEGRRLRVVHVYRWPGRQAQSIERLFGAIGEALRGEVEIVPFHLSSKWGNLADLRELRALDADLYHVTGDCHQLVWGLPPARTIVTVHDLRRYRQDLRGARRWLLGKLWFDGPLGRVAAVTAISEATREELLAHFPKLAGRPVEVIENCLPLGLDFAPKPFDGRQPTVLQVGTAPHKNLRRVAEALVGTPCRLLVVGPLSAEDASHLATLPIEVDARGRVDDAGLKAAYREADIVVFASEYEGFGLPILEAQAVGRPLVTSDRSPMREVAGEGALLVDPTSVPAIRAAIFRIVAEPELRAHLIAAGRANVARYTPAAVARRYLELYERVAAATGRWRDGSWRDPGPQRSKSCPEAS
jgi:glycosyltransferase involved in cell wall biosynthesis